MGPDILRWGGGLPREGVGAEKFGLSLEARETKLFWRDAAKFCRDIPEKFERKKRFVFNFRSLSTPPGPSHFERTGIERTVLGMTHLN